MSEDETVFDLDRVEAEAIRTPFKFRWAGKQWELLNAFKLDIKIIEDALSGDVSLVQKALQLGLGKQWEAFDECLIKKPLNLDATKSLVNAWTDHSGLDEGEDKASTSSSKSTGRQSKRTSAATTASGSRKPSTARKKNATAAANSSST